MFSDHRQKIFVSCAGLLTAIALSLLARLHAQQPVGNASQHAQQAVMENASRIIPPPQGYRFPLGTTFYYKADWRLFSAGVGSLTIEQDASGRHRVRAAADSTGFVARLYHIHDSFESLFDPKTFCSAEVTKNTEEGSRRHNSKLQFDYDHRKAVLEDLNAKSGEKKHLENDIPACSTDVLSGLFYVASLPLEPGKTYTFPVNDGGKTIDLLTHVEAREQIKTEAGTFNTLRVQPEPDPALMRGRGHIWLWYSDDADRIPVQMRGRLGWGTVTLHLVRIERPQSPVAQTTTK